MSAADAALSKVGKLDPVRANERGLTQRYGVENLVAIASREVPSSFLPLVRDALMMQESDALDAKADVRAALVEAASRDKSWFARGEAGQEAPSFDPLPAEEFQDNFVFSKASADALRVHDHGGGGGAAAGARRADGSARGVQKRPRDAAAAGAGSGGTHGATGGHAKRARGSTRRAEPQSGAPEPELSPELREITRELTTKFGLPLLPVLETEFPSFNERITPAYCAKVGIPHYLERIEQPMDLPTVKEKLQQGQYVMPRQLLQDLKLIGENAKRFHGRRSPYGNMGTRLIQRVEGMVTKEVKPRWQKKWNKRFAAYRERKRAETAGGASGGGQGKG